jgi:hypothetical protein
LVIITIVAIWNNNQVIKIPYSLLIKTSVFLENTLSLHALLRPIDGGRKSLPTLVVAK